MDTTLGTGDAAKRLGVTVKTLQRWEREGRLVPAARTDSNRRRYTQAQLLDFLRLPRIPPEARRKLAYCRVSSPAQRPDLANQRRVLEQFTAARGLAEIEFVEEIGGGLDFARKKFTALLDAIGRGKVALLVLAHRDRFTRFGFEWFEHYAGMHGCEAIEGDDNAAVAPDQD